MKGKMWHVIKTIYNSLEQFFLGDEKSSTFSVEQGVAKGYRLSPILFSVFIIDKTEIELIYMYIAD